MIWRLLPAAVIVLVAETASAADRDPWLGQDKALHAGASATIATGSYAASTAFFDSRAESLLFAGGFTLAVGATKELLDLAGLGDPSWKDFAWDTVGTVAGLALAWSMDVFVHGLRRPLSRTAQQSFVIRF